MCSTTNHIVQVDRTSSLAKEGIQDSLCICRTRRDRTHFAERSWQLCIHIGIWAQPTFLIYTWK